MECCRICTEEGQYNIFNDELCFETKGLKIYIVLNNFLFEKLYAQDEHSSSICTSCCNSLSDSYLFMTTVRQSEQNQKHQELEKFIKSETTKELRTVPNVSKDVVQSKVIVEEEEDQEITFEAEVFESPQEEFVNEPQVKKSKLKDSPMTIPETICYTHFQLEMSEEKGRTFYSLCVSPAQAERPTTGDYWFHDSFMTHEDSSAIYKCKLCVKAFSNAALLLKHTTSSHLCLWCLKNLENFKDLQQHSKLHCDIICHFCYKDCGSTANFRKHVKKHHLLKNLPQHIGILEPSQFGISS